MKRTTNRLAHLLRLAAAAALVPGLPLLGACAPFCEAADAWTWATCYARVHDGDPAALHSETNRPPAAGYAAAVAQARALVRAYVVGQNIPGLSLAVAADDEVVWSEGFGWADIDQRRPVTPATRFRIGSVAETMTAAAVGRLIERGVLDIDLPVRNYVPAYPEKGWPISTRQLMGHSAGLPHYGDYEAMLYRRQSCAGPLDAVPIYSDERLRFAPGTRFGYSGYGWMLVGAVVEAAAGEPFLEFMQREIFAPAGMIDTVRDEPQRTDSEAARATSRTTSFYWPFAALDTTRGIELSNNPDNTCLLGAAGLLTTPSDIVRFGAALLDGRLVQRGTLDSLVAPAALESGASTGHGLGWSPRRIPLGPGAEPALAYGRDGISAGGTASLLIVPQYAIVIAISANVSHARELSSVAAGLAALFAAPAGTTGAP